MLTSHLADLSIASRASCRSRPSSAPVRRSASSLKHCHSTEVSVLCGECSSEPRNHFRTSYRFPRSIHPRRGTNLPGLPALPEIHCPRESSAPHDRLPTASPHKEHIFEGSLFQTRTFPVEATCTGPGAGTTRASASKVYVVFGNTRRGFEVLIRKYSSISQRKKRGIAGNLPDLPDLPNMPVKRACERGSGVNLNFNP